MSFALTAKYEVDWWSSGESRTGIPVPKRVAP
jgi:hypothetical protein